MHDKFSYMSKLSDKMPVTLIPVEVPCQRKTECDTMTSQALWFMQLGVWSLVPACASCIVESGHQPLDEEDNEDNEEIDGVATLLGWMTDNDRPGIPSEMKREEDRRKLEAERLARDQCPGCGGGLCSCRLCHNVGVDCRDFSSQCANDN